MLKFWHKDCVASFSFAEFSKRYTAWCKRNGYHANNTTKIFDFAKSFPAVMPKTNAMKAMITTSASSINALNESLIALQNEMNELAKTLPEYEIVSEFYGVGKVLAPQIIAEIGDVTRFEKKSSLVAFAGLEPVENQSGNFRGKEKTSKKGSPYLRKALFLVMSILLQKAPADDQIYQYLNRKRSEGKAYRSYMSADCAKFLRIYYARVKEVSLDKNSFDLVA